LLTMQVQTHVKRLCLTTPPIQLTPDRPYFNDNLGIVRQT